MVAQIKSWWFKIPDEPDQPGVVKSLNQAAATIAVAVTRLLLRISRDLAPAIQFVCLLINATNAILTEPAEPHFLRPA